MKIENKLILFLSIFGVFSCQGDANNEFPKPDEEIEVGPEGGTGLASVSTNWTSSPEDVTAWMGYAPTKIEEDFYFFSDTKKNQFVSYTFAENQLMAASLIYPSEVESLVVKYFLSDLSYLGELKGTKIYFNEKKEELISQWNEWEEDSTYSAIVFTPMMKSDYFDEYGFSDIDLGLSVKWASANIGATVPWEYGDFYAWGETMPKERYVDETYKFFGGVVKKYNVTPNYGPVDNKTILENEDDVAHIILGGKWRIPTEEEWAELRAGCTWTWASKNGNNGCLVTGKNGKSIFLPATGYCYDESQYFTGRFGYYWSSSLCLKYSTLAMYIEFGPDDYFEIDDFRRCYGLTIRPVLGN